MSAFDFLLILLSFVFALALSQVLTSAGRMLVERRRVRPGDAQCRDAGLYLLAGAVGLSRDQGIDLAMVTLD